MRLAPPQTLQYDHFRANAEERDHFARKWAMMLEGLKTLVEKENA